MIVNDYDLDENWEKWEKIKDRFPSQRFLLFKRDLSDDGKLANIYFVNLFEMALEIQKNYSLFRYIVGFDFDPIKVVYEIQDLNSPFWNKVLSHSALHGILYGFGVKNALAFQWKHWEKALFLKETNPQLANKSVKRGSMKDLAIPAFMVLKDHVIVGKYKKEREIIQKLYKGRDFLDLTLERFTGNGETELWDVIK